tara:strand:+ start:308 stop:1777 length:1470 start_codon:yes stop_codon:yes gene_type:complete
MTEFIDLTSEHNYPYHLIQKLFLENFKLISNNDTILQSSPKYNFGMVDLVTADSVTVVKKFTLLVNLDRSGSMSEEYNNKMILEYAQITLKNIITYFVNSDEFNNIDFNLCVNYFDNENKTITIDGKEIIKVTKDNYKHIIEQINSIFPRGTTNISGACKKMKTIHESIDGCCAHILFTDGLPTNNYKKAEQYEHLLPDCENYYIGFGENHSGTLLNNLAKLNNDKYYFVDDIENAGIVYAEILNIILNKVVHKIKINVENCEIFYNGEWGNNMYLSSIPKDSQKKIFIRSEKESNKDLIFNIKYNEYNNISTQRHKKYEFENVLYSQDVTPEIKKYFATIPTIMALKNIMAFKENKEYIDRIEELFNVIKKWTNDHNLQNDLFISSICDDLYIARQALDKKNGYILTLSRYYSLLEQRSYQVRNLDMFTSNNCDMNFTNFRRGGGSTFPKPLPILTHQISRSRTSSYTTPSQQTLMRNITGDSTIGYD